MTSHEDFYTSQLNNIFNVARHMLSDPESGVFVYRVTNMDDIDMLREDLKQFYYNKYKLKLVPVSIVEAKSITYYNVYLKYDPDELIELCQLMGD